MSSKSTLKPRSRRKIEVIPSARRLASSMRDVGHEFKTAIADLIDNCIDHEAGEVRVIPRFDGETSEIMICDDGIGMNDAALAESLRYGSSTGYEGGSLGKFGLGLKTASTSQCKRLTVASVSGDQGDEITAFAFDLDEVYETDQWQIVEVTEDELPEEALRWLGRGSGTVVIWQKLDRLMGKYKNPRSGRAEKRFWWFVDTLDAHLGLVFNRFIAGEAANKKQLDIFVGNTKVEPLDPFAQSEQLTQKLIEHETTVVVGDSAISVAWRPFVLPNQNEFSSREAFDLHGFGGWNDRQGIWVYRNDRLIQDGSWMGLRTKDEHHKYARVALEFDESADEAFSINIAKMTVKLPPELRKELKPYADIVANQANKRYRGQSKSSSGKTRTGGRGRGSAARPMTPQAVIRALQVAATQAGHSKAFDEIAAIACKKNRDLARLLGR